MIFPIFYNKILERIYILNSFENFTDKLNLILSNALMLQKNRVSEDILNFVLAKSKKLRPRLMFLLSSALNKPISDKLLYLAAASELIHNATLIHDDIIDNSDIRRGNISLNKKLGNNLSVLSGDLLLAFAIEFLTKCDNTEIFSVFSAAVKNMCEGEINQHFSKNIIPSLENYIIKSEKKTAELFKASLISVCYIHDIKEVKNICSFAKNFGIAFQIKDDLNNILKTDISKPALSDLANGIYSAPVIFLSEKYNIFQYTKEEIIRLIIENEDIIINTNGLIKKYAAEAIASLQFIKDNQYKTELINLTKNLYEAI